MAEQSERDRALEELEVLVDRSSVGNILSMLSFLCDMKAQHIRENWQDTRLAGKWQLAASYIDIANNSIEV